MVNSGLGCSEKTYGVDAKFCIDCKYKYGTVSCKTFVALHKRWVHNVIHTYSDVYQCKIYENYENKDVSDFGIVCNSLVDFLEAKNKNYGNSALEPVRIFSKSDSESQLYSRIDDKLSRIKNSQELRKNDVVDLMGYLVLLCIKKGWMSFKDLID